VESLRPRVVGALMTSARVISPSLLRTYEPPLEALLERRVQDVHRVGKRLVMVFDDGYSLALHLMIAGRLRWLEAGSKPPARIAMAIFDFADRGSNRAGRLVLTEVSQKKRAALHVLKGAEALARLNPGGLEPLECDAAAFREALLRENHTLKRSLTDPRLFSGIGNAYSDEILHAARLSPVQLTKRLSDEEVKRLHMATQQVLSHWIAELRRQFAGRFPAPREITAFRPGFAVHGLFGQPCPQCSTDVQRIRYADNETNYCPVCQTEGRILADRSLSRLLREDWPRHVDDLEKPGELPPRLARQ
jgi:formamidopyrimidine-DNA glycosylase